MAAGLLAFACDVDRSGDDPAGYYFTGVVYNGETGAKLEDYSLTLTQAGEEDLEATVDGNGAYSVGPLKPGSDYVVTIDADGYRPFFAAEAMKTGLPTVDADRQVTQYFEAYVFPTDLESPAVTFDIFGEDSISTRPSGKVRFAPKGDGASALNLGGVTTPAVGTQMWANDADRKLGTVASVDLTDGVVEVPAGELVYGVAYTATVYAVDGHAYESFDFTAGLTGHQTVVLDDLTDGALQLMATSLDTGDYSENGTVTYTFNFPIEYSPTTPDYVAAELIDDGITIGQADSNENTEYNVLINTVDPTLDDPNDQERRTSIEIEGNTLTISWPGFENADAFEDGFFDQEDLISVTYSLTGIMLRRVGSTDAEARSLSSLVGASETVQLVAPAAP
jgi:hypothetical protein